MELLSQKNTIELGRWVTQKGFPISILLLLVLWLAATEASFFVTIIISVISLSGVVVLGALLAREGFAFWRAVYSVLFFIIAILSVLSADAIWRSAHRFEISPKTTPKSV